MSQSSAAIYAYIDSALRDGQHVRDMEQDIRAQLPRMEPWLTAAWEHQLASDPPCSLAMWACSVLEARDNARDYPRT